MPRRIGRKYQLRNFARAYELENGGQRLLEIRRLPKIIRSTIFLETVKIAPPPVSRNPAPGPAVSEQQGQAVSLRETSPSQAAVCHPLVTHCRPLPEEDPHRFITLTVHP